MSEYSPYILIVSLFPENGQAKGIDLNLIGFISSSLA